MDSTELAGVGETWRVVNYYSYIEQTGQDATNRIQTGQADGGSNRASLGQLRGTVRASLTVRSMPQDTAVTTQGVARINLDLDEESRLEVAR